jgi:hypothetical protein
LAALDIDVSPLDNSKTKKERFSRTYKGVDGYVPIFSYLGTKGYLVTAEVLRWEAAFPEGGCGGVFEGIDPVFEDDQ